MKRLLFIIPAFNHGGTNRSLLNILSCLDDEYYSKDIFALSHMGPYREIFAPFRILNRSLLLSSIFESYEHIKQEPWIERSKKTLVKLLFYGLKAVVGEKALEWSYRRAAKRIGYMNYDTVIAMQEERATHFTSHIKTRKVAWIRSDYDNYFALAQNDEEHIYNRFDHIICVSAFTREVFIKRYPSLASKCHGIHNMIDYKAIIALSQDVEEIDERFTADSFCIISIGRLSPVKQFNIIPKLAAQLKKDGCRLRWYIIGAGEEEQSIQNQIDQHQVSDMVILLGQKNNPYPYLKRAHLLVCTSASEACPNVINEARILHVPVVTTDFGSAPEFINNGTNGIIASQDNLKNAIEEMINNQELYQQIKTNISSFQYSNDSILKQITMLI
jgi:glycosyltransferase involved in cell wall biosynthesis